MGNIEQTDCVICSLFNSRSLSQYLYFVILGEERYCWLCRGCRFYRLERRDCVCPHTSLSQLSGLLKLSRRVYEHCIRVSCIYNSSCNGMKDHLIELPQDNQHHLKHTSLLATSRNSPSSPLADIVLFEFFLPSFPSRFLKHVR